MPSAAPSRSAVDLLFTGTVFCDLVFSGVPAIVPGGEVFADGFLVTPGGAANRAVAGARLGASSLLVSHVGDDRMGEDLLRTLRAEPRLDLSALATVPDHRTGVTVSLTGESERSFVTYLEERRLERPPTGLTRVGAAHLGIDAPVPDWCRGLRSSGTIIVGGVGYDPSEQWSTHLVERLADVDVFVPNELEAMRYTRLDDPLAAARRLGDHVPLTVVTRGRRGAFATDSATGETVDVPALPVTAVDPTGAGDVFVAALMTTLLHEGSLAAKVRFAAAAASLSVRTLGGAASAPRLSDLTDYLDHHRPDGDWSEIRSWLSTSTAPSSEETR